MRRQAKSRSTRPGKHVMFALVAACALAWGTPPVAGSGSSNAAVWRHQTGDEPGGSRGAFRPGALGVFEENLGQANEQYQFLARASAGTIFLGSNEFLISWPPARPKSFSSRSGKNNVGRYSDSAAGSGALRVRLIGAEKHPKLIGTGRLPAHANYIRRRNSQGTSIHAQTYRKVEYRGIYRGIDLIFHKDRGPLEYDFIVRPGADPKAIVLNFDGARPKVDRKGNLVLTAGSRRIVQKRPFVFQHFGSSSRRIAGGYRLLGKDRVAFWLGSYDRSHPLVIDPVLPFSDHTGGGRDEGAEAIAVDPAGNVYVAGWTSSSDLAVRGGLQQKYGGYDCQYFTEEPCGDAFLAKYDSRWNLIYSTFLGGSGSDSASDIAVDRAGNVYVAGRTESKDFPGTGPVRHRGGADAFVVKIDSEGDSLIYSALVGGSGDDSANAIALDPQGSVYLAGSTASTDFATTNSLQRAAAGGSCAGYPPNFEPVPCNDAFVAKVDPSGTNLAYSTYLGGSGQDLGTDIAIDDSGYAYVTGETASHDFPTVKAAQASFAGGHCFVAGQQFYEPPRELKREPCPDVFVAKLEQAGSALVFSTFMGGAGADSGNGIGVDSSGGVLVAGKTNSKNISPARGFQREFGGGECLTKGRDEGGPRQPCSDAVVFKLDGEGSRITYTTYLGGAGDDQAFDIAVDRSGHAYIVGSATDGFPLKDAIQPRFGIRTDAFVAKLNPRASGDRSLGWSTYLGGSGREYATALALDRSGAAFVAGRTDSRSDFPTAPLIRSALQGGQLDAFVLKLSPSGPASPLVTSVMPRSGPASGDTEAVIDGKRLKETKAVRFGKVDAKDFKVSDDGGRITVTVPRHSKGTVPVNVITAGGESGPLPAANYTFGEGGWKEIPGPKSFFAAATVLSDGSVFMTGGCDAIDGAGLCRTRATKKAHLFDARSETWKSVAPMTFPRVSHSAISLPEGPKSLCGTNCGKVLVAGPMRSDCAEVYDPKTGKWSRIIPTVQGTRLPTLTNTQCSELEAEQLVNGFQTATLLPSGPGASCGKRCGNVLFAGRVSGAPGELFDPSKNSWTSAGMGQPLGSPGSGDAQSSGFPMSVQHTATLLSNGQVLFVGGVAPDDRTGGKQARIYDPVQDKTINIPGPNILRYGGHTSTLLTDGQVLVTGGMTDNLGTLTASTELFDPVAADPSRPGARGIWKPARDLGVGRFGHDAVRLLNGKVLIAGGVDVTGDPNARRSNVGSAPLATELYDPSSGRWSREGVLSNGRIAGILFGASATTYVHATFQLDRLKDGRAILLGGGRPEIYTPGTYKPTAAVTGRSWILPVSAGVLVLALGAVLLRRRHSESRRKG